MKVGASVRKICEKCRLIRRRGSNYSNLFQNINKARIIF